MKYFTKIGSSEKEVIITAKSDIRFDRIIEESPEKERDEDIPIDFNQPRVNKLVRFIETLNLHY